jgi:hypothetical protein
MQPLSIVVHGESGSGKSWFADTVPGPRLVLDAEGGSRFTPSQPKVFWDPTQGPPPLDAETVIVMVRDFSTMSLVFQWLNSGQHNFKSVIMDSVTELQKRCIDAIVGTSQMRIQDFGQLLRDMEYLIRQFRDLHMHPTNPIPVAVLITTTKMDDKGTFRPHVQGQLNLSLPYFVDVVGYLHVGNNTETGQMERKLLVSGVPGFIAKDRTNRLGYEVIDPNVSTMLTQIYGG